MHSGIHITFYDITNAKNVRRRSHTTMHFVCVLYAVTLCACAYSVLCPSGVHTITHQHKTYNYHHRNREHQERLLLMAAWDLVASLHDALLEFRPA